MLFRSLLQPQAALSFSENNPPTLSTAHLPLPPPRLLRQPLELNQTRTSTPIPPLPPRPRPRPDSRPLRLPDDRTSSPKHTPTGATNLRDRTPPRLALSSAHIRPLSRGPHQISTTIDGGSAKAQAQARCRAMKTPTVRRILWALSRSGLWPPGTREQCPTSTSFLT